MIAGWVRALLTPKKGDRRRRGGEKILLLIKKKEIKKRFGLLGVCVGQL
jgi:hypothetical protein